MAFCAVVSLMGVMDEVNDFRLWRLVMMKTGVGIRVMLYGILHTTLETGVNPKQPLKRTPKEFHVFSRFI